MLRVRCSCCGRNTSVSAGEAGLSVLCTACGTRIFVPLTEPDWAPPLVELDSPQTTDNDLVPPLPARSHALAWVLAAVGIACILGGLAVAAFLIGPNAWERQHRAELLAMQDQAESLAAAGRLREACDTYRQLRQQVGDRAIRDRGLAERLARARRDEDRVFELLLAAQAPPAVQQLPTRPATLPAPQIIAAAPPASAPATAAVASLAQLPQSPVEPVRPLPTTQPPAPLPPPVLVQPKRWVLPRHVPEAPDADALTDERIGQAIQHLADQIVEQFDPQTFEIRGATPGRTDALHAGMDALCVYALLQAGQAIPDPRLDIRGAFMKGLVKRLRELPMEGHAATYARGLRATALAIYNRPEDHNVLKADVAWLVRAGRNGAYTYDMPRADRFFRWDNSNSQYGALGIWSGCEVNIEVPAGTWERIERHWVECQAANGQWGYTEPRAGLGTLSMTVAGIATLFVTQDYLDAPRVATHVGQPPFSPPLARALAWLEEGDHCIDVRQAGHFGYTLYGIERVGLASGFKYLGSHDWYRELSATLLNGEDARGRFQWRVTPAGRNGGQLGGGDPVELSYKLLFLSRGRHPLVLNKLRFDGFWANRPRDAANLARYAARQLERPLNWQVVSFGKDFADWMDCPILYLASHEAPKLTDAQIEQLRNFALAGGLIFTQADGNSPAFNAFVQELSQKLFPDYELQGLPLDHELYSLAYPVNPKPPLKAVSNGSRILLLHSPTDLSQHWQMRADKTHKNAFDLGTNLFLYASGKSDLRNRLSSTWLAAPAQPPTETLKLARLMYAGNWDPEPAAFVRFGRWLQKQTGLGLETTVVAMAGLKAEDAPLAHLTGTAAHTATQAEVAALRQYVQGGGVLIIDAAGGNPAFANSVRTDLLPRAFPDAPPSRPSSDHPLLAGKLAGMENVGKPLARSYATRSLGAAPASPVELLRFGKGRVIFSSLDITTGLLGTNTWGILGYRPEYAQALMKNALLWVAYGAED